jgi:hypothetical protein
MSKSHNVENSKCQMVLKMFNLQKNRTSKSQNVENSKRQMILKMFHLRKNIGIIGITDRVENDAAVFGQLRLTIKHLHLVESCPGNGKMVCVFLYSSFSLSVFLSLCLSVFLSLCLSVLLSFCSSVFLSFCLSVFLSFCLSVFMSFYSSVFLSFINYFWDKNKTKKFQFGKKEDIQADIFLFS